jgi:hypothetical protein
MALQHRRQSTSATQIRRVLFFASIEMLLRQRRREPCRAGTPGTEAEHLRAGAAAARTTAGIAAASRPGGG